MRGILLDFNKFKLFKITFILFVIFFIFMVVYFPNYTKLMRLKQANCRMLGEIEKLEKQINDLEEKIKKAKNDPFLLEKFVRNELGAVKKDEIVIDIQE